MDLKIIYKACFSYEGTNFFGWQFQPNKRTVQGEILSILKKISPNNNIKILASSRTDRGVHAREQWVRIELEKDIPHLERSLESLLPEDLLLLSLVQEDFHPFSYQYKEYRYFFSQKKQLFKRNCVTTLPKNISVEKFKEAWFFFLGKKSFHNYKTRGQVYKSHIRNCFFISVEEKKDLIMVKIKANGFLKQMIRLIAGACLSYAKNQISEKDIQKSFDPKISKRLGVVTPPQGLFLWKTFFIN